jgi:hypothetical protein
MSKAYAPQNINFCFLQCIPTINENTLAENMKQELKNGMTKLNLEND